MALNVETGIRIAWIGLALVWLIGLAFTKRTVRSQPVGARLRYLSLAALGFGMLGSRFFRQGWLGARFVPGVDIDAMRIAGLVLTVAGCLFAIWARVTLGGNWSGAATVKAGHELVTKGPYSLARHPIYTGLLLAVVGTAFDCGEWRCIIGAVIILLAFIVKIRQEERLMMQTFPDAYPLYRQRVKALIPGVF